MKAWHVSASVAGALYVEQLGEPEHDALKVADVEPALPDKPRLALLHGLRVPGEDDPDGPALLGKVRAPWQIYRSDLEDRHGRTVAEVAPRRVEQARAQRRTSHGLRHGGRVHNSKRLRRDTRAIGRQPHQPGRVDERVRHDLLKTDSSETVAGPFAKLFQPVPLRERQRPVGNPRWETVVSRDATDLLDDVLGDRDVGAHDRRRRDQGVAIGGRRELKPAEDIERLAVIDVD